MPQVEHSLQSVKRVLLSPGASQIKAVNGGDSFTVQDQLKNVRQVQATDEAFAAILENGFVVSWGKPDCGGDSSQVQD